MAFAIKSLKPEVKVYGVQAEGAPSMYRSLHEHKYQTLAEQAMTPLSLSSLESWLIL